MRQTTFWVLALGSTMHDALAASPPPPQPEPITIIELPLPPVLAVDTPGACNPEINPLGTGCISQDLATFQAGDFTPTGAEIIANLNFIGAPSETGDPSSAYSKNQLALLKADGATFPNGDSWKCLSCGIPPENAVSPNALTNYPHVFRSGEKALWGDNILECGGAQLSACEPNDTYIYPIHWDTGETGAVMRELRIHPDDVHLGWSAFTPSGGQHAYIGRLSFNPSSTPPRYDVVDVNLLLDPTRNAPIQVSGTNISFDHNAIMVGELRGFSGSGDEVIYIGSPMEANNHDLFAVHLTTGAVRRLTSHPEYVDPVVASHDGKWLAILDTRGTDRQMFMSGMRHIPPLTDIVVSSVAASTRNNGERRFFNPILIDRYGDRGEYFGQQINAVQGGDGSDVDDPNWNARADPAFSPDGTRIMYYQALVVSPACGGKNPLPCPVSTADGGREYRVMLAQLTDREPAEQAPVFDVPDYIPWATPYDPDHEGPGWEQLGPGEYTLAGLVSGVAEVNLTAIDESSDVTRVSVIYTNYSDEEGYVIDGHEDVSMESPASDPWERSVHWYSDITQTGVVEGTKKTSADGFHLEINVLTTIFDAVGTLTTTLDGVVYEQPANGT